MQCPNLSSVFSELFEFCENQLAIFPDDHKALKQETCNNKRNIAIIANAVQNCSVTLDCQNYCHHSCLDGVKINSRHLVSTFQLQEYQSNMGRCRFGTLAKLTRPTHSEGPARWVSAFPTAAGPPSEVTSVINILCGGREEGVGFPSLHLH